MSRLHVGLNMFVGCREREERRKPTREQARVNDRAALREQGLIVKDEDPVPHPLIAWNLPTFAMNTRWEQFGEWDSFNQNWAVKLVRATAAKVTTIRSHNPGPYMYGSLSGSPPPALQTIHLQQLTLDTTN